jgi:hypothetical protein
MVKCIRTNTRYMMFGLHSVSSTREEIRETLNSLVFATYALRDRVYDTEHRLEFVEMVKKNG